MFQRIVLKAMDLKKEKDICGSDDNYPLKLRLEPTKDDYWCISEQLYNRVRTTLLTRAALAQEKNDEN